MVLLLWQFFYMKNTNRFYKVFGKFYFSGQKKLKKTVKNKKNTKKRPFFNFVILTLKKVCNIIKKMK